MGMDSLSVFPGHPPTQWYELWNEYPCGNRQITKMPPKVEVNNMLRGLKCIKNCKATVQCYDCEP